MSFRNSTYAGLSLNDFVNCLFTQTLIDCHWNWFIILVALIIFIWILISDFFFVNSARASMKVHSSSIRASLRFWSMVFYSSDNFIISFLKPMVLSIGVQAVNNISINNFDDFNLDSDLLSSEDVLHQSLYLE